jgi:PAS domain-containing protein
MNAVAQRLTGWDFADARGSPLQDVFQVIDATTRAAAARSVSAGQQQGDGVAVVPCQHPDGARWPPVPDRRQGGAHPRPPAPVSRVWCWCSATSADSMRSRLPSTRPTTFSRQVLQGLPVGLNVRDLERRYREWNPAMAKIVGAPPEQVIGKTMQEAFPDQPPEVLAAILEATARAERGELVVRPDTALEGPAGVCGRRRRTAPCAMPPATSSAP